MRATAIVVVLGFFVVTGPSVAPVSARGQQQGSSNGTPFQALQQQIDSLKTQYAAPATSGNSLVVVDSKGTKVGQVLGVDSGLHRTVVGFSSNGKVYPVDVLRNGYPMPQALYFSSTGCTGQVWMDPSDSPFPAAAVKGGILYGESGSMQTKTLTSWMFNGYCYNQTRTLTVVPLSQIANLGTMFVPPFSVTTP